MFSLWPCQQDLLVSLAFIDVSSCPFAFYRNYMQESQPISTHLLGDETDLASSTLAKRLGTLR